MADGGAGGRPMLTPGSPEATVCRHCQSPKFIVRGFLLCETCDAPMIEGETLRPTWKPRIA